MNSQLYLEDSTNTLITGSSYKISRLPLGRVQLVQHSPKRLPLCQQFFNQPSSSSYRKPKLPVFSNNLYKDFLTVKTSSLKCKHCQRVSCKCSRPGNIMFATVLAQKSRRRSVLIGEIREEISVRGRGKVTPRRLRQEGRSSAREWRPHGD